jgi:hypothetical protein
MSPLYQFLVPLQVVAASANVLMGFDGLWG